MSDHWRDLHRHPSGKFLPRPGKKGFRIDDPPKPDAPDGKPPTKPPSGRGLVLIARTSRP